MRPAALVAVCNEIVHGARTRIVECGSGLSTVVLARLLRERGDGALVALEHDRHWAALVEEQLRKEDLGEIARVHYAPLGGEPPWYDLHDGDRLPGRGRPPDRRRTAGLRSRARHPPGPGASLVWRSTRRRGHGDPRRRRARRRARGPLAAGRGRATGASRSTRSPARPSAKGTPSDLRGDDRPRGRPGARPWPRWGRTASRTAR